MIDTTIFEIEDNILLVHPIGTLESQDEVFKFVDHFTREAFDSSVMKILIDEAYLAVKVNAFDVVMITNELYNSTQRQKGFKIAAINSNDVGISYIAELVAEQKAIDYKHFSNKSKAKNWLLNS